MKDQATIPVITTEQILGCLSKELQEIQRIIVRLKIKFPHLRKLSYTNNMKLYQQIELKLEELERLGKVLVDIKRIEVRIMFGAAPRKVNRKHWKLK